MTKAHWRPLCFSFTVIWSRGSFVRFNNENNNRLLLVPYFIRAQSTYKGLRMQAYHHTHTSTHAHKHARMPACTGTHMQARMHAHTHTHAHTKYMHYWWCVGRMRREKKGEKMRKKHMADQYAEEKRWVFSFDSKEESKEECLTDRGRKF